MSDSLSIVMYHYTRDLVNSRYPEIKGLDVPLFKKQLDFFAQKFNVVTMEQVLEAVYGGGHLPKNAMLLTFDDGYIDNYTVAMPLLSERGMQGSFFIPGKTIAENVLLDVNKIHFILASSNPDCLMQDLLKKMDYYRGKEFDYPGNSELMEQYAVAGRWDPKEIIFIKRMLQTVLPEALRNKISTELFEQYVGLPEDKFARELYMNHDQIGYMKRNGMYIGFHGYDHYWMANLTEDELKDDMDKGLSVIGQYMDMDCWVINYPYGNYSEFVYNYAASRGAKLGLSTDVRVARIGEDNPMILPRLNCNDYPPKSENYLTIK